MKKWMSDFPVRIAFAFFFLTAVYISISDAILAVFVKDPSILTRLQTYKGWAFITLTSIFLYRSLNRQMNRIQWEINERSKTEAQLAQQCTRLDSLLQISAVLRTGETLEEMLPALLDKTLSVLGTDAGVISIYHPISGTQKYTVSRGFFARLTTQTVRPTVGITGRVLATGQPYVSAELVSDPVANIAEPGIVPVGWGGACLPLNAMGNTLGLLFVAVSPEHALSAEDLKLLSSLAEIAGSALHRTWLHEETNRRLSQLHSVREVGLAINQGHDFKSTLDLLLEQVLAQLGAEAGVLYLINRELNIFEYSAGLGDVPHATHSTFVHAGNNAISIAALEQRTVVGIGSGCSIVQEYKGYAMEGCSAVPLVAHGEVQGVLVVYCHGITNRDAEWFSYLETLAGYAAMAVSRARLIEDLQHANYELTNAYDATIDGWAFALDLRDKETEGHSRRVTEMTVDLARRMGIKEDELIHIRRGAILHDVGKMGVPDHILLKPGKLDDAEWEIMKKHPQFAYDMLSRIDYLKLALDIPYSHHEKWDGSGYPMGLRGQQIPLAARIFAVVDVFDALTSDRPYRHAWSREEALKYIESQRGTHFDPAVVDLFLEYYRVRIPAT